MGYKIIIKSDNTQSKTFCYITEDYSIDTEFIIFVDSIQHQERRIPKSRLLEVIKCGWTFGWKYEKTKWKDF